MIPSIWRNWTNCLGLTGACLIFVGCGGSDVPDPEADSAAATEAPAPAPPQVAAAAPKAEEPKAEEAKAEEAAPTPAPAPAPVAKAEAPPTAVAAAPKSAEPPAGEPATTTDAAAQPPAAADAPPKPDAGATTAEMLALSAGTSPTTPPPAGGAPGAPAAGAPAPGGPAATPAPRGRNSKDIDDPPPAPAQGAMARGNGRRDELENSGGGRTREDGVGRAPRDNQPVNFSNPRSSVQAFLDALEDKDVDRLSEATALRSPYEASAKHQDLFKRIVDGSISEAQLNDLAENLDGYTISGEAQVHSTGQLGILVSKTTDTGRLQRKITVRKEKAGWKVLDITDFLDFKTNAPRRTTRGRATR